MENLKMFCLSLEPKHLNIIRDLNYTPVGLGDANFNNSWLLDKTGNNISNKNKFYGEYTFHYWLWKNYFDKLDDKWVGFCQYRKFWTPTKINKVSNNFLDFKTLLVNNIPEEYDSYDSIIGEPIYINQFRFSKFIKKNLSTMIRNPSLFINKKKRNIKFHFDMMHGHGNLLKAINLLDDKEKKDFTEFVNNSVSFNPHNMFICKSKKLLKLYYESLFPWLERCEGIFGFDLEGYGMKRMYGFLAERYMSYWFMKYSKFTLMPILFKNISDFNLIKAHQ